MQTSSDARDQQASLIDLPEECAVVHDIPDSVADFFETDIPRWTSETRPLIATAKAAISISQPRLVKGSTSLPVGYASGYRRVDI